MNIIHDLSGLQFGLLTVIKYSPRKTKSTATQWLCRCECGRLVIVRSDNLKDGRTTKCSECRNGAGRQSVFYYEEEGENDD